MRKTFLCLIALVVSLAFTYGAMADTDIANNGKWRVSPNGDYLPVTTNTNSIGNTTYYASEIYLGGIGKSSWGSIVTPWTDTGSYAYLTSSGANIVLYFNGTISTNGTFDSRGSGGYILGNDAIISNSSDAMVTIVENGDTYTLRFDGNQLIQNISDGGFVFAPSDTADGNISFMTMGNLTDYIKISSPSGVPTVEGIGTNGITFKSGTGAASFDNQSITTTGALSAGAATLTSVTLPSGEVISNTTAGAMRLASDSGEMKLEIHAAGTTNEDAVLQLSADANADNGDAWQLEADGTGNYLTFKNNATGAFVAAVNITTGGAVTTLLGVYPTGDLAVNTSKFTVEADNGNTLVAGILNVTGDTTVTGVLNATSDVKINSTRFTVAAATGNVAVNTSMFTIAGHTGNTGVNGTLAVKGDFAVNTTAFTVNEDNGVTAILGNLALNTSKFTVASATGNTGVNGTLAVLGNVAVNTSKFTIDANTGNTGVNGTLSSLGDFKVNTTKFTVNEDNGNTAVAGTLAVTGVSTFTGAVNSTDNLTIGNQSLLQMYNTTGTRIQCSVNVTNVFVCAVG